jgi:hypothetical protein
MRLETGVRERLDTRRARRTRAAGPSRLSEFLPNAFTLRNSAIRGCDCNPNALQTAHMIAFDEIILAFDMQRNMYMCGMLLCAVLFSSVYTVPRRIFGE